MQLNIHSDQHYRSKIMTHAEPEPYKRADHLHLKDSATQLRY